MAGISRMLLGIGAGVAALIGSVAGAGAQDQELNIYSSRHYQSDEALYDGFTEQTGIGINRIEADADELLQRIRSEGANSPADVFIAVDAGRLWRATEAGILRPVESKALEEKIPESLRHPDGLWYGFSTRARLIFYDRDQIDPEEVGLDSYEDLADPRFDDMICIRSGSNVYNQSLLASLIAHHGEDAAREWARGVRENLARNPQGGDTDQLKAAAAGECAIAVANHYYYLRMATSDDAQERAMAEKLGVIFPNQGDRGVHVNISGAGVVRDAPHPEAAVRFLEYLASDDAQRSFAGGNNEYPVVEGVDARNEVLDSLGSFETDPLNVSVYGENQALAQRIFDEVGWN